MGKTAFCLNIAEHAALRADVGVAVFSLEMSKEQLAMRMLCSEARVDLARVRTGHLSDREFPKLAMAAGAARRRADLHRRHAGALRARAARQGAAAEARPRARSSGSSIVDYLQLMRSSEGKDSREQEISEISRSLKALAKELQRAGGGALAAQPPGREPRTRRCPRLADLRESGAIEQDADVIIFLYREEYYDEDTDKKGVAEIIVAKQRNGPIGSVELTFLREYTRFENREVAPDDEDDGGQRAAGRSRSGDAVRRAERRRATARGGVGRADERADHGDGVGAGRAHRRGGRRRDAADGDERAADGGAHGAHERRARAARGRPPCCVVAKIGPDAEVVGAGRRGGPGLVEVVGRDADDRARARGRARAAATGRSSWPRWTPSAPAARATSGRSFTRKQRARRRA